MENKIILAYYINVGNIDDKDKLEYIRKIRKSIKSDDSDNMIQYFIPVREESRVECVYPKYVVGEEVDEEFKDVINRLNEHVKNFDI